MRFIDVYKIVGDTNDIIVWRGCCAIAKIEMDTYYEDVSYSLWDLAVRDIIATGYREITIEVGGKL